LMTGKPRQENPLEKLIEQKIRDQGIPCFVIDNVVDGTRLIDAVAIGIDPGELAGAWG